MTNSLKPLVKWVGGKRQLLSEIHRLLPPSHPERTYFEPFLGGGAVLFSLLPNRAIVNDVNAELINLYQIVKDQPADLINLVSSYPHEKEFYYRLRDLDRNPVDWQKLTRLEKAARTLYLNRAGFNGLYRVNAKGHYNVPFGRYKTLNFDTQNIWSVYEFLRSTSIEFSSVDYREALTRAKLGDFAYIDPPYDPTNPTSSFTAYTTGGFNRENQIELRQEIDRLTDKGVYVMLSNSATDFVRNEYSGYTVHTVKARRQVNSKGTGRGYVEEIIVTNYDKRGELHRNRAASAVQYPTV
ncbi:DNA adenine methylase [Corynebacterium lipophiloflavum]|uniref:DNA adenine methylase n=1 Tax=Corynebacterium lipophiloflavum TaxID=161889 RepID=UPI001FE04894|nr:DNA adenine methylase [Corynebacterium lipophiloflavum]